MERNRTGRSLVEFRHRLALFGLGDVDIRLHGGVIGVAGPFHDDIGRDAHGEGVADEGAATSAGAKHGIFGPGFFYVSPFW